MHLRAWIALPLFLSACATVEPSQRERMAPYPDPPRIVNLRRAAALPWTDGGSCVVREASNPWSVLAERCFHVLDRDRVRFRDLTGKCAVAAVPLIAVGVGACILAALEIAAEAVVVVGSAAGAINEAIDAYERSASRERPDARPHVLPPTGPGPETNREPEPEGFPRGGDWFPPGPPGPPEPPDRDRCTPKRVKPKGGDDFHNWCANHVPFNDFRNFNVLVNGKAFDALQTSTRTLWEVKTSDLKKYNDFVLRIELDKQVKEAKREGELAAACGFNFVIGVCTEAHKAALLKRDDRLRVVVMDWCVE